MVPHPVPYLLSLVFPKALYVTPYYYYLLLMINPAHVYFTETTLNYLFLFQPYILVRWCSMPANATGYVVRSNIPSILLLALLIDNSYHY